MEIVLYDVQTSHMLNWWQTFLRPEFLFLRHWPFCNKVFVFTKVKFSPGWNTFKPFPTTRYGILGCHQYTVRNII